MHGFEDTQKYDRLFLNETILNQNPLIFANLKKCDWELV